MSSRFAAGLSKLKDVAGKAPSPVASVSDLQTTIESPRSGFGAPPSRRGKVAISAYFDPAVRQQLAILAVKENRSQASLMAEALNLMFERYGEPPIARA